MVAAQPVLNHCRFGANGVFEQARVTSIKATDHGGNQAAVPLRPYSGDDHPDSGGAYLLPNRGNASNLPTPVQYTFCRVGLTARQGLW